MSKKKVSKDGAKNGHRTSEALREMRNHPLFREFDSFVQKYGLAFEQSRHRWLAWIAWLDGYEMGKERMAMDKPQPRKDEEP